MQHVPGMKAVVFPDEPNEYFESLSVAVQENGILLATGEFFFRFDMHDFMPFGF